MARKLNISPGDVFGGWVVIAPAERRKQRRQFLCECLGCGARAAKPVSDISSGHAGGCYDCRTKKLAARSRTHGHTTTLPGGRRTITLEFRAWLGMRHRCYNQNGRNYHNYGGRGITVCDRWKDNFENFLADMPKHPGKGYSLDRINNDGNYEPGNCRWATQKEQVLNRRCSYLVEAFGERLTAGEWAARLGIGPGVIERRLHQLGWEPEKAVSTPLTRALPRRAARQQ